jgi:nitrogen regulatory protein PII
VTARVLMVVRPQRAEALCQRLLASGLVQELNANECRGYGRQKGHLERYEGTEYRIDFLPKVAVHAMVEDGDRDALVDLVCSLCRTGRIGDGKIFFIPVERQVTPEA